MNESTREKQRARCIRYYNSHKDDPEFRERQKRSQYKWRATHREKYNEYQKGYQRELRFRKKVEK